ncbi:Ni,Fe-hydrogenase I large subunit [Desulfitobacterium dehalogenans ATCC 51507]|uniref:Ni,Fe-hydrogenase I large subunit n=1 Tax=Desulfitobacterium dehalogenans (strain ATCC 51507 / DSM 9161 / JW/IU-DC1) TaxID=756499 RepID=I4AAR1_DESDJ|nr:nickel-dependent hydrogenase large subunit [Desulfitobacterium dehalogenans]AFM01046.1 Ni,Fe-hydrogenase I large subunit [Desulfitobacterium dehalogenans ATCC 51507]
MAKRVVIDPVTRVEGHLRVEVEIEKGIVTNAWAQGTMFRGIEQILQGRDPRDAVYITERICGVCMASHGWTSAMAVEDAHGADVPRAAQLIRNLIAGSLWLHDHPLHFYHLSALDYLDVLAVDHYKGNAPELLAVKNKILSLVKAGDTAPLTPRYQPDRYSVNDPEIVITALAHYLEALKIQGKAKKMSAILGGKQPHQSSIVVGGVTIYPRKEQLDAFRTLLNEVVSFAELVYVPDVVSFCTGPLLGLGKAGVGAGSGSYIAYGGFPMDDSGTETLFRGGFISGKAPGVVEELDMSKITESVASAWYKEGEPANPWDGDTVIDFDKKGAYSFIKSPRYKGEAAEVGPLARMMVMQHSGLLDLMSRYGIKPGAVARHLARAQETLLMTSSMYRWLNDLEELLGRKGSRPAIHDSSHWEPPAQGQGVALNEAPRGSLGHWLKIDNNVISNYQMVVPTTWNSSPRDEKNMPGPVEQALKGLPVDPDNPVNVVRVIRSFDPCLACAVHLIDADGEKIVRL